ncbi:MAG: hypothetical protein MPJ50_03775 [Pirellulales bacterium]|nr:hypothetical protein [Pirellulales bacterium]
MDNSKKHLFWILSGAAVVVLLAAWAVGWWMITSTTAEQVAARDRAFQSITSVTASQIPNDPIKQELETRKSELTDIVYQIWQKRFQAQQEHFRSTLSDKSQDAVDFLTGEIDNITTRHRDRYWAILPDEIKRLDDVVKVRQVIEPEVSVEDGDNRGNNPRLGNPRQSGPGLGELGEPGEFSDGMPGFNPRGAAATDVRGGQGRGLRGIGEGDMGMEIGPGNFEGTANVRGGVGSTPWQQGSMQESTPQIQYEGIVDWQDRDLVLGTYLNWTGTPTEAQVQYAIEYWAAMYSVLNVIGQTNGDADHYQAPIKQIRKLRIGRLGPKREGGIQSEGLGPGMEGPGMEGPGMGDLGMEGPGMEGGIGFMGGFGDEASESEFSLGRPNLGNRNRLGGSNRPDANNPAYSTIKPNWGLKGFELPAVTVQLGSKDKLEQGRYVDDQGYPVNSVRDNPHVEFRMIPLYLEVVIDQAEVGRFFGLAADSPLPIEVQQICAMHAVPESEQDTGGLVEYAPTDVVLKLRGVIYLYQTPVRENIGKSPAEIIPEGDDAAVAQTGSPALGGGGR